jgi:hypothetical protein
MPYWKVQAFTHSLNLGNEISILNTHRMGGRGRYFTQEGATNNRMEKIALKKLFLLLTKYVVDHIKENEMGEAYGTYGGEKKCIGHSG